MADVDDIEDIEVEELLIDGLTSDEAEAVRSEEKVNNGSSENGSKARVEELVLNNASKGTGKKRFVIITISIIMVAALGVAGYLAFFGTL